MKKLITVLVTVLLATATFAQNKSTIAVPAPKAVNLGDGSDWIPLFIQGVITSNFQQYSGMKVVDRQNADMVKAEQRLSENAAYDEKSAIELGKLTSARLIITGSIMAKSNAYALTFSITDAETGETKATSSIPNCLASALEDGTAANQVSYDLMKGYGISLSSEAQSKLTQKASVMSGETAAQASLAKGIVAEQNGTNIEALTYYIQARKSDKKLGEATSRMANMTTVVTSGNYGANAKNLMKLRNDWDKLLREAAELIASNPPEFELRYFSDIEALELTAQDYERGTMSFSVGAPYLKQVSGGENGKIARELLSGLHKIEQSKNWGDKINGFPWSYGADIGGDNWLQKAAAAKRGEYNWKGGDSDSYSFAVSLLDGRKKVIAKENITLSVSYGKQYTGFAIQGTTVNRLTFSNVPVNDADTDKLYVTVENTGKTSVSIVPVADDVLSRSQAIARIKSGAYSGTVKIGGLLNGTFVGVESSARIFLDMSEMEVSVIRSDTFNGCRWLTGIVLPAGLREIDSFAFVGCRSLESITLPDSLQRIANKALAYVPLATVNYGGTMEQWNAMEKGEMWIVVESDRIGVNVLGKPKIIYDYSPETEKRLAEHSSQIAEYSAHPEKGVPAEAVPEIISEMKNGAHIKVTGSVSTKSDYEAFITALRNSEKKFSLDLSNTVGIVELFNQNALLFAGLRSLTSIVLPESITKIHTGTFVSCTSLTSIVLPESITEIHTAAFLSCTSLKTVNFRGSKKQWKNIKISKEKINGDGNGNKALLKAKINYDYKGD